MRIPLPRIVKRRLKKMLTSPAFQFMAARHVGVATCLNYHSIVDERSGSDDFNPNIGLSVHVEDFEAQIRFVAEHCVCLTVAEGVRLLAEGRLPPNSVLITFDDGYRDNYTLALPILEKYGVPATIFVTTGLVGRTANLWWEEHKFIIDRLSHLEFRWRGREYRWDLSTIPLKQSAAIEMHTLFKQFSPTEQQELSEIVRAPCPEKFNYDDRIMSWDEVTDLARHELITIGAHTLSHPVLAKISLSELTHELSGSKVILEERLNRPIDFFAYPIGQREHASVREFQATKDVGFTAAFTSRSGHLQFEHARHLHSLPRIPIDYFDTIQSLRWKLSGFEAMLQQRGRYFVTD